MSLEIMATSPEAKQQRRRALETAHVSVGQRRTSVEGILDRLGDEFAVSVKFGRGIGRASGAGEGYGTEEQKAEQEDAALPTIGKGVTLNPQLRHSILGSVPGNKMLGRMVLPCGVCLIVGAGGVGKSPLAQELAGLGKESIATVRIGEPMSGYNATEHEAALDIARAMVLNSDVVVDSVKDLLGSGGNLMKAGISREALIALSGWSANACDLGCTLYIPVNPSSADEEVMELLAEAARSNATSTLIHSGGDRWTYVGRTGEGLPRVTATIIFDKDGVRVEGDKTKTVSAEAGVNLIMGEIDNYRGALRRSLVRQSDSE